MNSSMQLRFVRPEDIESLYKSVQKLWEFHNIDPAVMRYSSHQMEQYFRENLFQCLVVEDCSHNETKKLAAICIYTQISFGKDRVLYLENLFVEAVYRKMGLGTAMLIELMHIAQQKQNYGSAIHLLMGANNTEARQFYYKLGFRSLTQIDEKLSLRRPEEANNVTTPPTQIEFVLDIAQKVTAFLMFTDVQDVNWLLEKLKRTVDLSPQNQHLTYVMNGGETLSKDDFNQCLELQRQNPQLIWIAAEKSGVPIGFANFRVSFSGLDGKFVTLENLLVILTDDDGTKQQNASNLICCELVRQVSLYGVANCGHGVLKANLTSNRSFSSVQLLSNAGFVDFNLLSWESIGLTDITQQSIDVLRNRQLNINNNHNNRKIHIFTKLQDEEKTNTQFHKQ